MSHCTSDLYDEATDNVREKTKELVQQEYVRLLEREVDRLSDQRVCGENEYPVTVETVAKALVDSFPKSKVMSIKCLRSIFALGLLQAKDQIDWAEAPWLKPTTPEPSNDPFPGDLPF